MIHLAVQDLRHDLLAFGFSVLGLAVLVFAFLLLIPLSLAITRVGEAGGQPQNLIILERDVLQPEQSLIVPGLAQSASTILGDRVNRVDPVIFRIMRIEGHPMQLRGVAFESWETTFHLQLLEGEWPSGPSEVVLGQLAAQAGGWSKGSEIGIYGRPFRVAGIADGPGTKTQTVWMSFIDAEALFGPEKGAQLLVVHLQPSADPIQSRLDLEDGLRSMDTEYDVYFEDALLREYGAALNDLRSLSVLTAVIAIAAVTLGSHNLAWLAAEERKRLLGVLRAVGFDRRAVGRYFLFRAGVISVGAYLLALAVAILFIRLGTGVGDLAIGGTQTDLSLSPSMAVLGLFLTCAASLVGTWLSVRDVLRFLPGILVGERAGGQLRMSVAAWLALRDLSVHRRQAAALMFVFAIAVMAFVTLGAYRQTLVRDYRPARDDQLVVQETQSFAEFYGSRLSPDVAAVLENLGVAGAVAEIHTIVGTSLEDAVLLKGVDLDHYSELDSFVVLSGRELRPGDAPRQSMIGSRLAERLGAGPGDTIRLRGRPFEVIGVFENGSYAENEAWVPLAGAQELLGWGQDVSLYVVPDDAPFTPGEELLAGVSVARRGELWSTFPRQWEGLMGLIGTVTQAIGLAAALSLAAMLWRLAWRRRRQIAVLRSLGFSRMVYAVYLVVQGASVALAGGACGILGALALLRWARPTLAGVSLWPHPSAGLLISTAAWLSFLILLSVVVPVWVLGRRGVAELLRGE